MYHGALLAAYTVYEDLTYRDVLLAFAPLRCRAVPSLVELAHGRWRVVRIAESQSGSHGYQLARDEDVFFLRRQDGSLVGRFSSRGVDRERILHAVEDDRRGYPLYSGPDRHADSVRRYLKVRMESHWERFLNTERRLLKARRRGQLAKTLLIVLPYESKEEMERISHEDQSKAELGVVELRDGDGTVWHKHVEQLVPEDRRERLWAELRRLEWLLGRQAGRNTFLRQAASGRWTPPRIVPGAPPTPVNRGDVLQNR